MLIFYFTIKGVGGVQNLFYNMMCELHKREIDCKLLYYRNTWLTDKLDELNISYNIFDLEKDKISELNNFINKNDIVITTHSIEIKELIKIKPYYLFWIVHPNAFIGNLNLLKKIIIRLIIKSMIKKNGFFFMDKSCSDKINKFYNLESNNNYLPIPINIYSNLKSERSNFKNNSYNISYIGRAEDWKVNPVNKILSDLIQINLKYNINFVFHIVTDDINTFKELLQVNTEKINIVFHSNLNGDELHKFLQNEIDINFAMGTSCLESAKASISSILVDASYEEYPNDYKYNWIFETESYSLGKVINNQYKSLNGFYLNDIFQKSISDINFLSRIGTNCYNYVNDKHNIHHVTNLLLDKSEKCTNKLTPSIKNLFF